MTTIHRNLHTLLALSLLSTSFIALPANAKKLGADPYSLNWLVDQAKYRCTLEQKIPEFGKVVFSQTPSSSISLEFHALTRFSRGQSKKLKATPPTWRADIAGFLISSSAKIDQQGTRAVFNDANSQAAFKALKDGYRLQLALQHGSPPEKLLISIEGLGFSPLLEEFEQCREKSKQLQIADNERLEMEKKAAEELALTMEKLGAKSPRSAALTEETTEIEAVTPLQQTLENLPDDYRIRFDNGDTEITDTSAQSLDQLVRRWTLAGTPPEIVLHGHADDADSTGSYINSDLRAQSIVRYLITKMPTLKLRIEAHGDTLPIDELTSQRVDIVPSDLPNWE